MTSAGWHRWLTVVAPPVTLFVIVMLLWQFLATVWKVPPLLLPTPWRIAQTIVEQSDRLALAALQTAGAALSAFLISLILGTVIAMVFSQAPAIRRSCFPYAILLQTVPIVAVAPVIVAWVGEGFTAVVIVATIISLFPIITNVTDGMIAIPSGLQDLFSLYGATRWQTLRKLRLPHALPHLVTGARIAAGASVLGAIVGEMFAGVAQEHPGLGYVIFAASDRFNMAFVFAAIAATTLLGVILFAVVSWIGNRYLLYWRDVRDADVSG